MKKVEGYFDFRFVTVKQNEKYTPEKNIEIEVTIKDEGFIEELQLILYSKDKIYRKINFRYVGKKDENISVFKANFKIEKTGIYWYCFGFKLERRQVYLVKNEENLQMEISDNYPNEYCWRLKINDAYLKEYKDWIGRAIYQIIPDRFAIGSNGIISVKGRKIKKWDDRMPNWQPDPDGIYRNEYFYGGDLKGIKEKLPYIKKLGFSAIYITPIWKSRNYHHYEAENFFIIDPMLGDWKDLADLCAEAKKLGIKVIVDVAFNHTSDEHEYFKKAIADEKSPYRKYYIFINGEAVTWHDYKNMPELNKNNKELQKELRKVLKMYIKAGVDAFRMDLGDILPREFLLSLIKPIQEEYEHIIFFNEMWDIATDRENPEIFDGQANSLMNYPLRDAIIRWVRWGKYEHFKYNINKIYTEYPMSVANILMNVISTHDTVTLMTALVGKIMNSNPFQKLDDIEQPWRHEEFDTYGFRKYSADHDQLTKEEQVLARKLVKVVFPILYISIGNPCILQGTENCIMGYKDPFCRKSMDWDNPDKDMQSYIKSLNTFRIENIDILGDCEPRIRYIDEELQIQEMYSYKASIILISNRTNKVIPNNDFKEYKVIFSENSTKERIGEFGTVILRKDFT